MPTKYDAEYFAKALEQVPEEYRQALEPTPKPESFSPIHTVPPKPTDYDLITISQKGNVVTEKVNNPSIIRFLQDSHILADGHLFRKFDGRIYSVMPEDSLTNLVYTAVRASSGTGYVMKPYEITTIVKASYALLDASSLHWQSPDTLEEYESPNHPLIAFENGILNMDTNKILPFSPYVPLTNCLHARYDPKVTDAPARKVLENILPDAQTLDFLFEMIGYILFDRTMSPPAIFTLYGPGETGKSAIANMIECILGDECVTNMGMKQLTSRFGPAELEGKLLNICGETGSESAKTSGFDGEMLKRMSSGERITVERKNQGQHEMYCTAKVLFCTNSVPDFADDSSGLYRRLYIIPCRQIQDTKARIYDKLTDPVSRSWVINKALSAYQLLCATKQFSQSPQMEKEREHFKSQNSLLDFLQVVFGTTDRATIGNLIVTDPDLCYTTNLYSSYQEFSHASLNQPMSRKKFVEKIRNEFNLDIKKEGMYLADGKHTTRDRYINGMN